MQKQIRSLLAGVLSISFINAPAQAQDVRTTGVLDKITFDYKQVKSIDQFVEKFASGRAEKGEFKKRLSVLKKLPELKRTVNGFELVSEDFTLKVEAGMDRRFVFNGLTFAVDPKQSLVMQTEILYKKLDVKSSNGKYSWFSLLIPQAHAVLPVVAGGLIAKAAIYAKIGVGLAIANKMVDRYGNWVLDNFEKGVCFVTADRGQYDSTPSGMPQNASWCKDYWTNKTKAMKDFDDLAKKSPETEAFKVALKSAQPDGWKFGTITDKCPTQSKSGLSGPYTGFLRVIYDPKEDKQTKGNTSSESKEYWINVKAEFDGQKLKEVKVFKPGNNNTEAVYKVDAESVLTDILVPAPEGYKDKGFMSDGTTLKIPAVGEIKDPVLKSEQTLHKVIFAFVASNVTACFKNTNERETAAIPTKGAK